MTNYKEVFELAQDRGYKRKYNYTNWNPPNAEYATSDDNTRLLELTLIQKWLRDEYKIVVQVEFMKKINPQYKAFVYPIATFISSAKCNWLLTYEEALLNGIYEALKLITNL